ncbi:hypothetical protein KSF_066190 [Reticulibacter mediterranei]|uniref:Uncharacterized protein n=1 Tax=Reticulibacter mediterranei TaxID=2778369 RepID=A0A8J3IUR4_9CHLR|nr:hypothetical protein KSF_066190 [Reticulibacter mediterranei]
MQWEEDEGKSNKEHHQTCSKEAECDTTGCVVLKRGGEGVPED